MTSDFDIYLASSSPRRRELLDQIAVKYQVIKQDLPEQPLPNEAAHEFVQRMALNKARTARQKQGIDSSKPVLGADTAVIVNGEIIGKPLDQDDGLRILGLLSGRCHEVFSAVALIKDKCEQVRINCSRVCFRELSDAEKLAYWQTGEPVDKAGAYGIQGPAAKFITKLEGSYSGVMGLPLFETAELIKEYC